MTLGTTTFQRRRRTGQLAFLALFGVLAVGLGLLASLYLGSNPIAADVVTGALVGTDVSPEATVVLTQRLPRTLLALIVGLALGAAGALMQGHTRNPLAEPGLFGVNAGAAFGVVVAVFALDASGPLATVFAALAGALLSTTIVVAVAWGGRAQGTPMTLALTGATLGALLAAATSAIVLLDDQSLDVLRHWNVGSLQGRPTEATGILAALAIAGLALACANARGVTALGLGDDMARSLGNRVATTRIIGILSITLLTASATAAVGPVAFVGLVAPYMFRWATGPRYTWLIPLSALGGAILVLFADVAGRIISPAGELPVGFVVAFFGAPALIAVVSARKVRGL